MRLAIWSPLPPSSSGIADYVAEALPELSHHADITVVVEDPAAVDPALASRFSLASAAAPGDTDLALYHLGNSPPHAYVYRRALSHPGVAFLHDWNLHQLVLFETVERGDTDTYLRAMRRAHGERGAFAGRQIARALGGQMLPALLPLGAHVLDGSLAAVALTTRTHAAAARRLAGRPALHLAHHVSLPLDPLPSRAEARHELGLPQNGPLIVAPGLATAQKQLDVAVRAAARLRSRWPDLRLVAAGGIQSDLPLAHWVEQAQLGEGFIATGRLSLDDFVRALVASDIVLALRFPSQGEMSGALMRALGVGRPVLVTSGTAACDDFPAGIVVPIDPGAHAEDALASHLSKLIEEPALAARIGSEARAHVEAQCSVAGTVESLARFLQEVAARDQELRRRAAEQRVADGSLLQYLLDELGLTAHDLGLADFPLDIVSLLRPLAGDRGHVADTD
jgi:glycosyltransferase involved in cell wall biosynthesis